MAIKLFGFTLGRSDSQVGIEGNTSRPVSFVPPNPEDGASYVDAAGGFFGQYIVFDGN